MAQDAVLQDIKKDAQKKDPKKKLSEQGNGKRVQLKSKARACNDKLKKLQHKSIRTSSPCWKDYIKFGCRFW